ncbi:hypothetical protein MCOR02_005087 [Pyricularia oryzae]|nr:hypothetical protein MCOR02_005087 [Pyricularia oryzae]
MSDEKKAVAVDTLPGDTSEVTRSISRPKSTRPRVMTKRPPRRFCASWTGT